MTIGRPDANPPSACPTASPCTEVAGSISNGMDEEGIEVVAKVVGRREYTTGSFGVLCDAELRHWAAVVRLAALVARTVELEKVAAGPLETAALAFG